ncbi:MAG: hemerythrin domain-containing protein [Candidatus Binataceae bacterium]
MSGTTQFAEVFKNEHRAIRDSLLNLIQAFRNRDVSKVNYFLTQAAALAGPHFRYEEEAFYPALIDVLDEEQVRKLISDHDRAIDAARNLARLAARNELTEQDAQSGAKYTRSLLPHVFECDGLSIMAELLPEEAMRQVLDSRDHSRGANLDLLRWANTARSHTAAPESA